MALVTCGPAYEPLDRVRRLTNFSTGEIGSILSQELRGAGWDVVCYRGEGATFPPPSDVDLRSFSTNASLEEGISEITPAPSLVFHAAALCDFEVSWIEGGSGTHKLSSSISELVVGFRPARKILPHFRNWFPDARIIGWKYELDGTRSEAIERAHSQMNACRSDACVLNGVAYGDGFGLLIPGEPLIECPNKVSLARELVRHFGE